MSTTIATAYNWKKEDAAFSAKWDEAVETALDKLEGRLYTLGIDGERQAITDTLKARHPGTWGNNSKSDEHTSGPQTNYFLNVTVQERLERLDRLGLPRPVIESDREEDYAADGDANNS